MEPLRESWKFPPSWEVRQEDIRTGIIKWYSPARGFGFVIDEETRFEYFVHHTSIEDGRTPFAGDRVTFKIDFCNHGRKLARRVCGGSGRELVPPQMLNRMREEGENRRYFDVKLRSQKAKIAAIEKTSTAEVEDNAENSQIETHNDIGISRDNGKRNTNIQKYPGHSMLHDFSNEMNDFSNFELHLYTTVRKPLYIRDCMIQYFDDDDDIKFDSVMEDLRIDPDTVSIDVWMRRGNVFLPRISFARCDVSTNWHNCFETTMFALGVGMVGKVGNGCEWNANKREILGDDDEFVRRDVAKTCGLVRATAVAIRISGRDFVVGKYSRANEITPLTLNLED